MDVGRDAADQVALTRQINPTAVVNVASWMHRERSAPERAEARAWVAEVDGRTVGRVECFRNFFTEGSRSGFLNVAVLEEYRRRGIGRALYDVGARHAESLELAEVLTRFHENDAGVAFATGLGFNEARAETDSVLDPRTVREAPSPDADLRPVATVDPRLVYDVDLEATLDMPQTEPIDHIPYDEWEEHVLRHPLFTAEGSFVAMADGVAAAVSLLVADVESGRSHNMFLGTLRAYRGRGLGRAVKLASIRWATANGITMMATNNDETNAPMLAINQRLGYRPAGRRVEYLRKLK
ncbi:MAG TPA: GNAT family N-acetyltransferase [Gaiellaceae bacterium]|jgi:GNAT superfamily N-acetyltransferase|nr:GNAT family N-acetyltransferase [Gaiellaceae bacterium]